MFLLERDFSPRKCRLFISHICRQQRLLEQQDEQHPQQGGDARLEGKELEIFYFLLFYIYILLLWNFLFCCFVSKG